MRVERLHEATNPPPERRRNAIGTHLEAANRLVIAAVHALERTTVESPADELERRGLCVLAGSLGFAIGELLSKLHDKRALLEEGACPHCAWAHPASSSGRCPRCQQLRAVPRERPVRRDRGRRAAASR